MPTIDPKELQAAYESAMAGTESPSFIITPEGVLTKSGVRDFDADGNFYELPPDEQARRMALMKARMGIK